MPIITSDIQLSNSDLPLLTETILNQQSITKDGNSIPISNLVLLPQVLASLDIPANPTTLKVIDTILLDDATNNMVINPVSTQISTQHTVTSPIYDINTGNGSVSMGDITTSQNRMRLSLNDGSGMFYINTTNGNCLLGDVDQVGELTRIELSDSSRLINMIVNKNGVVKMGETSSLGNNTYIVVDDANREIALNDTNIVRIGDTNSSANSTRMILDDTAATINLNANTNIVLNSGITCIGIDGVGDEITFYGGVRFKTGFTNVLLSSVVLFSYGAMTYNIPLSSTQALGTVTSSNVGARILITNMGSNLTIQATNGQLIYGSSSGANTKVINTNDSRIITSIHISATTYGWSIVE